ncbi:enhancer of mRNA-decapping protein 3-like [Hippoglossus hippoglossus]|uniref:enhancer of mRNA-decapping protein 3-like n=1 Tax=Hippoglossus hippoglossus TaxID=8267 RepID=UPI00148C721E|nr:enhancer of mRNA-decapping protein 3-like [Hippoglossus hippoglossus]XP_035011149.1 enhancer of mRNA-decapping protein 3 [Hippoglossus stenolepis]
MASDWLGSVVSINCGLTLGVYQGEVSSVNHTSQTISLRQPYHNGTKCPVSEVTFSAMDIKELKFLDIQNTVNKPSSGQGAARGPSLTSAGQRGQSNRTTRPPVTSSSTHSDIPPITILHRASTGSSKSRGVTQATPKKNSARNGNTSGLARSKDDECFGGGTDEDLDTDFDFEGNLALFNKAAFFSQINGTGSHGSRTQPHSTQVQQHSPSFRHDENILEGKPVIYRQITVPQHGGKEYCTDSGLVVPSVTYEFHQHLLATAERWGLTLERRLEMIGVCSSQMALTLLGGPNRLTPKNVHQRPTVVLLCGPHLQGAQGISCGRHLANHGVEVILFLPNFVKIQEAVTSEVNLYSRTSGQQVASIKDLPASPVDLLINCLDCHEKPLLKEKPWYQSAAEWANQNRAPVLSIDPPVGEQHQTVEAKWTLSLGLPLPLAETDSRVYLCDIGIPKLVFQEVGIRYLSPFGCKFVIPLHRA